MSNHVPIQTEQPDIMILYTALELTKMTIGVVTSNPDSIRQEFVKNYAVAYQAYHGTKPENLPVANSN